MMKTLFLLLMIPSLSFAEKPKEVKVEATNANTKTEVIVEATELKTTVEVPETPEDLEKEAKFIDSQINSKVRMHPAHFYGAALTFSVIGAFGVGHAAQGRWFERGWIFTAGQAISAAFVPVAVTVVNRTQVRITPHLAFATTIPFLVFFVWEKIDLWKKPSNYHITTDIAGHKSGSFNKTAFFVSPSLNVNSVGLGLGLRF